jgi:aspartate 1-decarboxylase
MQRQMLKSKIHRATVTECDLHYAGSITIDANLMDEADLLPHELVHVLDVDNGKRFETYVIEGSRGSGDIQVNGAAARLVERADRVIIVSYGGYSESELEHHRPRVVHVDTDNEVIRVDAEAGVLP